MVISPPNVGSWDINHFPIRLEAHDTPVARAEKSRRVLRCSPAEENRAAKDWLRRLECLAASNLVDQESSCTASPQ